MAHKKDIPMHPTNKYGVYRSNGDYVGEVIGDVPDSIGDHVRATGMRSVRTVIAIDHGRKHIIIR